MRRARRAGARARRGRVAGVTITNEGTRPLRIRYNGFGLEGAAGRRYAAIPPFDVRGTVSEPVDGFAYPYDGFAVAPYLRRWYPAFRPFDGAFALDPVVGARSRRDSGTLSIPFVVR